MKCKKAKDFFLDYQELNEIQRRFLQEHLRNCQKCSKEYQDYTNALGLLKETMEFKPPENYWERFGLRRRALSPVFDLKSFMKDKLDFLFSLLQTPLLGTVPAYVFSFILLIFIAFGFSSLFKAGKYTPSNLVNNLIIYDGQLLSASDDGLLTIYTVSQK